MPRAAGVSLQRVASQELHITEEELEERLQQVFNLLPGACQCVYDASVCGEYCGE